MPVVGVTPVLLTLSWIGTASLGVLGNIRGGGTEMWLVQNAVLVVTRVVPCRWCGARKSSSGAACLVCLTRKMQRRKQVTF